MDGDVDVPHLVLARLSPSTRLPLAFTCINVAWQARGASLPKPDRAGAGGTSRQIRSGQGPRLGAWLVHLTSPNFIPAPTLLADRPVRGIASLGPTLHPFGTTCSAALPHLVLLANVARFFRHHHRQQHPSVFAPCAVAVGPGAVHCKGEEGEGRRGDRTTAPEDGRARRGGSRRVVGSGAEEAGAGGGREGRAGQGQEEHGTGTGTGTDRRERTAVRQKVEGRGGKGQKRGRAGQGKA